MFFSHVHKAMRRKDANNQKTLILAVIISAAAAAADSVGSCCSGQRDTSNDFPEGRLSGINRLKVRNSQFQLGPRASGG